MNHVDPMREYQVWEARFPGPDGVALVGIGGGKYDIVYPDGSGFERQSSDYLLTEDGVAWDPRMLRGPSPVYLVCCRGWPCIGHDARRRGTARGSVPGMHVGVPSSVTCDVIEFLRHRARAWQPRSRAAVESRCAQRLARCVDAGRVAFP